MIRSRCPRKGLLEAPLPLHIKATNWPLADEIDVYNADLVVAIIEVIAGNKTPRKNHLILPVNLFGLNLKQTGYKIVEKRDGCPLVPTTGRQEEGEGP